jgi:hypothetical protein
MNAGLSTRKLFWARPRVNFRETRFALEVLFLVDSIAIVAALRGDVTSIETISAAEC